MPLVGPTIPAADFRTLVGSFAFSRHPEIRSLAAELGDERLEAVARALHKTRADCERTQLYTTLALSLATRPDGRFRDPKRAVQLAKKAASLWPDHASCWHTLGVAQYRAREWNAAIEALEKSMELSSGGDGFEWFFLAMAHWQLDHKEEARRWYYKAVEWMEKNKPDDEQLRRFRAEAAELLGVTEKESGQKDDKPQSRKDAEKGGDHADEG